MRLASQPDHPDQEKRDEGQSPRPSSERPVQDAPWQSLTYCQAGLAVKSEGIDAAIAAHRCKRWSCEHCNPINRRQVIQHAVNGKPKALLTLTVSSKHYDTPEEAAAALKRGLRLLRLRLRRTPRLQDFQFLAVFEAHESGYPHLHLLIRGRFIPWQWLRNAWTEITGSMHVDIRKIKGTKDAARYVAKYLGKDLHAFEGCKRWWRSHGYDLTDKTSEEYLEKRRGWCNFTLTITEAATALHLEGYAVRRAGLNGIRAGPERDGLTPVPRLLRQLMRAHSSRGTSAKTGEFTR